MSPIYSSSDEESFPKSNTRPIEDNSEKFGDTEESTHLSGAGVLKKFVLIMLTAAVSCVILYILLRLAMLF